VKMCPQMCTKKLSVCTPLECTVVLVHLENYIAVQLAGLYIRMLLFWQSDLWHLCRKVGERGLSLLPTANHQEPLSEGLWPVCLVERKCRRTTLTGIRGERKCRKRLLTAKPGERKCHRRTLTAKRGERKCRKRLLTAKPGERKCRRRTLTAKRDDRKCRRRVLTAKLRYSEYKALIRRFLPATGIVQLLEEYERGNNIKIDLK
jgi:hypothetical protein